MAITNHLKKWSSVVLVGLEINTNIITLSLGCRATHADPYAWQELGEI